MRKLYPLFFIFLFVFLASEYDSYGQNGGRRKQMRSKSRKISQFTGNAQRFDKRKQYNGLGINVSSMNYFGDLSPKTSIFNTDLKFSRPQIGITYQRRIGTRYTLRTSFAWGRLSGDDYTSQKTEGDARYRYTRNLHFRNDIKELSVVSQVDLFENKGNYLRRVEITPYIFGGVAVFHHNPKAIAPEGDKDAGKWVALNELKTEGKSYSNIQLSLPLGVGVRWRITDDLDMSFELGYRYTFTDYLDDVSGNYLGTGNYKDTRTESFADRSTELKSAYAGEDRDAAVVKAVTGVDIGTKGSDKNRFSSAGEKRGSKNKDIYIVTGIHITYVFVGNGIFGGKRNAKFR